MPTTPLIIYDHVGKSFAGGSGAKRVIAVDDVQDVERGAEFPGLVVKRKMRGRPPGIARRAGMKIEGAIAEPGEHARRDDFRRHERNQPGPAQQIGVERGKLGGTSDRDHGQKRVMPA